MRAIFCECLRRFAQIMHQRVSTPVLSMTFLANVSQNCSFQRPRALNQELSSSRSRGGGLHEEICMYFDFSCFCRRKLPKSGQQPPHHRGAGEHQAAEQQGPSRPLWCGGWWPDLVNFPRQKHEKSKCTQISSCRPPPRDLLLESSWLRALGR